jgi:SAM-dependent methyltransferase
MSEFYCFTGPGGPEINSARQNHLASLGLDLTGKRVLEVGAGIGLHTPFFLERNCDITVTDGFPNNVEEIKRRHPALTSFVLDLEQDVSLEQLGHFDVIYCYGLLYHLGNAESALRRMSEISDLLLLETVVSTSTGDDISFLADHSGNNGSIIGRACRPSRLWVLNQLKKNYGYGYVTATQPNYPDFVTNWESPNHSPTRSIFVGSTTPIENNPLLVTTVPMRQTTLV